MPLYIRDESVATLASQVQRATGAPTKTEAVRLALANELARHRLTVPLPQRIAAIAANLRAKAKPGGHDLTKAEIDDMWGH